MTNFRIRPEDVAAYRREILETCVLVDPATAARMLAVTPRTIRNYAASGRLQPYNAAPGCKGLRFLASELRDYVKSLRVDMDL